jgi:hypothetical protein
MTNRIDVLVESYLLESNIDSIIKKIARMTDRNDHSGAAVAGADLLNNVSGGKFKAELSDLIDIQKQHETLGSMPYELGQKRYAILKKIWQSADKYLPKKQADKFVGSF